MGVNGEGGSRFGDFYLAMKRGPKRPEKQCSISNNTSNNTLIWFEPVTTRHERSSAPLRLAQKIIPSGDRYRCVD